MINSPLILSGCLVWLDASDTSYLFANRDGTDPVLLNGDPVGFWGDKSGNNLNFINSFGTELNRANYISRSFNGLPSIRFNGTSSYLTLTRNISTTLNGFSAFIVTSRNNLQSVRSRILTQTRQPEVSAADTSRGVASIIADASNLNISTTVDTGGYATNSHRALSTFDIFSVRLSASPPILNTGFVGDIRNGRTISGGTVWGSFTFRLSSNMMRIGSDISNSSSGATTNLLYDGDISEIIIFDRHLSDLQRHQIEYYLAKKWNIENANFTYPVTSGNWSNINIWAASAFPVSSTEVYTNGSTVLLDQDIRVRRMSNATLLPNITLNTGTFNVNQPRNIISFPEGFTGNSTTGECCITSFVSSGNLSLTGTCFNNSINSRDSRVDLRITGNVLGSFADSINLREIGSKLTVYGNVSGGGNSGAFSGIRNNNYCTITVYGNVSGGTNIGGGYRNVGLDTKDGIFNIYGDVHGGESAGVTVANYSYGVYTEGNLNVYGNVYGGGYYKRTNLDWINCNPGIGIGTYAQLNVYGDVYASVYNNAIYNTTYLTNTINLYGSIINADNGVQAVFSPRYNLIPKIYNSYTVFPNTKLVNLLNYSEDYTVNHWTKTRATVSQNISASPIGTLSACFIREDTSNNTHVIERIFLQGPSRELVFSNYFKMQGRRYVTVSCMNSDRSQRISLTFDLLDGIVTELSTTGGTTTYTFSAMEGVGNGWWRCSVGNIVVDATKYYQILPNSGPTFANTTYTGNVLSGVLIWGSQINVPQDNLLVLPYVSSLASFGYRNIGNEPFQFFSPDSYKSTYIPVASSVRLGLAYAGISSLSGEDVGIFQYLTGSMIVPSNQTVSLGTFVDNTVGTAIITNESLQNIWTTNVNILTSNNTLFSRMANSITNSEAGYVLENIQTL